MTRSTRDSPTNASPASHSLRAGVGVVCARLLAAALSLALSSSASAQPPPGRTLEAALRELQAEGLKIVFSSELVRPDMRVEREPPPVKPRQRLDLLLRPHGLDVRNGPNGALLVVRARRSKPRATVDNALLGNVAGAVVDARTNAPLAGVLVTAPGLEDQFTTAADGTFEIRGLAAGPQPLFVSLVGYSLSRPTVEVRAGETTRVLVPLADGTTTYVEQVMVTGGSLPDAGRSPTSSRALASAELQKLRGVLTDDPFRAVQAMPGVATSNDLRSEFSVRGSDFRHMGSSIDGLPTPWLLHNVRNYESKGSIATINADVIDQADLAAGAQPQTQPGRTGAWLNFRMREGSRTATQFHGAVSMASASVIVDGPIGGNRRGSWLVAARQSYLQWLIRRIQIDDTAFAFSDAQSKVVFDVTPKNQLQFGLVAGRARLDQQQSDVVDEGLGSNELSIGTRASAITWAAWQSTIAPRFVLEQRLGFVAGRYENTHQSGRLLAEGSDAEASYAASATWAWRPSVLIRTGGLVQRQRTDGREIDSVLVSAPHVEGRRNQRVEGSAWISSMDARLEWHGRRGDSIDTGVRFARSTLTDRGTASPWILGSLPVSDRISFRAGVSAPRQLPDFDQVVGTLGRRDARPERARAVDIGLEARPTAHTRWQLVFYDRREHDVLRLEDSETRLDPAGNIVTTSSLTPSWRNALEGRARGIEVIVQRHANSGLGGWIGYAYGRARYTDTERTESFWADLDQRHALSMFAEGRLSAKTSLSGTLRVGSGFPLPGYLTERTDGLFVGQVRNAVRLPAYARLDVRADHTFNYQRSPLTLFAEVVNVFNRTNYAPDYGGFVGGGRALNFTAEQFPILPAVGILVEF